MASVCWLLLALEIIEIIAQICYNASMISVTERTIKSVTAGKVINFAANKFCEVKQEKKQTHTLIYTPFRQEDIL